MFAAIPIFVYLVALMIAPQLWVAAIKDWRVDLFIYPFWLGWLVIRGRLPEVFRFRAQDWFFAAMVLWMTISAVVNGPTDSTPVILVNYFKWLILYRLTIASIGSEEELRAASWALILVASIVSIEAIQHLWAEDGLGWAGQSYSWVDESAQSAGVEHRTRWVGIFDGPGVFCVIFTLALPFAMGLIAPGHTLVLRLFALGGLLPLLGLAVFSTGSRGGFLTALAVFGFWGLSRFKVRLRTLILACIIAGAGIMVGPAYLTSMRDSSGSAQHRVDMWVEGVEMAQGNPVFGIGKGNFMRYTGRLIAHNSGVEVMGETGLVGLFLWFGVYYFGMKSLVIRFLESESRRERELLIAVGLALIGYFVSSLFVTLEYETLYFVLGLAGAARNWSTAEQRLRLKDVRVLGMITVGYFVFIKIFVMLY